MTGAPAERLDRFMARANRTYYATRDPFADFATAPGISQVFGELLGAWAAASWDALGRPDPVILLEPGPGRGAMMADALRLVAAVAPAFGRALRLHFVEFSPSLAAPLASRFPGAAIHPALDDVPSGPAIVLANEFLDALPIRQWVRRGDRWAERFVADGGFVERDDGTAPAAPPDDLPDGAIVERSDAAEAAVRALAARGAVALLIDYGGERDDGDTLQALRDRRPADPLAAPGCADLSAHVGFARLLTVARAAGGRVHGPLAQGVFLSRLGLYGRTRALAARHHAAGPALIEAANRLAQPERMGVLFKAMAITPPAHPVPAGFDGAAA